MPIGTLGQLLPHDAGAHRVDADILREQFARQVTGGTDQPRFRGGVGAIRILDDQIGGRHGDDAAPSACFEVRYGLAGQPVERAQIVGERPFPEVRWERFDGVLGREEAASVVVHDVEPSKGRNRCLDHALRAGLGAHVGLHRARRAA